MYMKIYVCKFLFCKLKVMPMYNAIAFGFRDDDGGIPLVYILKQEKVSFEFNIPTFRDKFIYFCPVTGATITR